jgi:hypothetical protein
VVVFSHGLAIPAKRNGDRRSRVSLILGFPDHLVLLHSCHGPVRPRQSVPYRPRGGEFCLPKPWGIQITISKDVVEKSFLRTKNSLGINRLRVHSQEAMDGKMLIAFIALILNSHIHKIMHDKNLYRNMSMTDLVKTMEKLKVMIIGTRRIEFPATKKQKEIAEAFGLKSLPVG